LGNQGARIKEESKAEKALRPTRRGREIVRKVLGAGSPRRKGIVRGRSKPVERKNKGLKSEKKKV